MEGRTPCARAGSVRPSTNGSDGTSPSNQFFFHKTINDMTIFRCGRRGEFVFIGVNQWFKKTTRTGKWFSAYHPRCLPQVLLNRSAGAGSGA
ncbi:hypothetical protein PDESU_06029 [Pontiella desulfatans]|uniref:Uncharacterized protein n=1 Tax=Pontiella desulfatans TaxID=2750659 RepID=A0A6C2UC30_PONDE|nr:hypothetical protein PDESU_06029 [Pontiella desulfatans]